MVSSAPRVWPGLGGPAAPYHISCCVSPKLKLSTAFSRLAKRASDTTTPSFASASACLVFSGVTRLSVPRSSSLPQRPQLERLFSIATTCSNVTRCAGSCVDGCGAVGAGGVWLQASPERFAASNSAHDFAKLVPMAPSQQSERLRRISIHSAVATEPLRAINSTPHGARGFENSLEFAPLLLFRDGNAVEAAESALRTERELICREILDRRVDPAPQ